MLQRLADFKAFNRTVKGCTDVVCITDNVRRAIHLGDFAARYENERQFAERDTSIEERQKARLIQCGFEHAQDALMKTLSGSGR